MEKIKHTPGPWGVSPGGMVRTADEDEYAVACVYGEYGSPEIDGPVARANGCLISAAPDLASALHLVASKTVLTSGIRAVVDAALTKAGYRAPELVQHVRIAGGA
ncbi:TPA: hypothetical protein QDB14_004143 [Burkholderia vietnamiensis]|nr:hypothetical protein [Burkholderia vietnamiensis]